MAKKSRNNCHIYRLGVLARAARAACVAELSKCVEPAVDIVTVVVSLMVAVSASRRRRSSSIDGCAYDSPASNDDVPPADVVDDVMATSWELSTSTILTSTDGCSAVGNLSTPATLADGSSVLRTLAEGCSAVATLSAPVDTDVDIVTSTLDVAGMLLILAVTSITDEGQWADGNSPTLVATDGNFIPDDTLAELKLHTYTQGQMHKCVTRK